MELRKRIVYVLRSENTPTRYYTGLTSDIAARLAAHNAGRVPHTADGKPWIIDLVIEFSDQRRAVAFEKYLKSGSGHEFARRHLR
jgi:predicted GIY-YIG superfamily endonuclease